MNGNKKTTEVSKQVPVDKPTLNDVRMAIDVAINHRSIVDFTECKRDDVLRTIAYLDEAIEAEQEHIEHLVRQRTTLLTRAQVEDIVRTGDYYLITTPGPMVRNKITNITEFAEKFPAAYASIRESQRESIEKSYRHDIDSLQHSDIPLGLADAKLGKDTVSDYVGYRPQVVKAEVRRVIGALK